jgi:hypothetical protein
VTEQSEKDAEQPEGKSNLVLSSVIEEEFDRMDILTG